jgi:hypothetical protein
MLKNRYQEIIVGLNLMSLMRGLISLRRNKSVLLIDDHRFAGEGYSADFLSELEIKSLVRLGKKYELPEIQNLRQFVSEASLDLVMQDKRLRLGARPYQNLRELLRKYPELIDASDLDQVYGEVPEEFDHYFLHELNRYEELVAEAGMRSKSVRFELMGPKWMKSIYQNFSTLLNREYSASKDLKYQGLLHLLGLSAEDKLKTELAPEDVPFYFFRMLSPVYRLQGFLLMTQLKRRLLLLGGDYKESLIQYWQMHADRFENLLLASFEGVVSGERVLFFSHLPEEAPFRISSPFPIFRKTQMTPLKRSSSPFPPNNLYFLGHSDLLGSDRPYRVLAKGPNGIGQYQWPYLELPGSKAEFYSQEMLRDFESDLHLLGVEASECRQGSIPSVSLDLRQNREKRKSESPVLERLPLKIVAGETQIQGFEYWGPFRYRSLGLLALCYGVEEI